MLREGEDVSKRINKFNLTEVDGGRPWGGEIRVDEDPPAITLYFYRGEYGKDLKEIRFSMYGMDAEQLRDDLTKSLRVYRRLHTKTKPDEVTSK